MKNAFPFFVILLLTSGLAAISGIHGEEEISPVRMCEQVAHEVNNAYLDGLISEAQAHEIITRCFSNHE